MLKLDPLDPRRIVIASLLRIVVPMGLTAVGLELASDEVEKIVVGVATVVWIGISLWTSVKGRKAIADGPSLFR